MAESTNPYEPPQAVVDDTYPVGPAGGTLEGGIAGEYDFSIRAVLGEAWTRTKGLKGAFWAAAIIVFVILMVLNIAVGLVLGAMPAQGPALAVHFVAQLGLSLAVYPFMVGLIMLGVRRSVDLPVGYTMAFGYFGSTGRVLIASFLMLVLVVIGFLLLVLPGIYLSIAYLLVLPLIAEKGLGAWGALEASRKAVTAHWFKVFFLLLIMGVIFVISALPLFIGLIWTYPMMMNVMGILYREMFGVEDARVAA
jgi:uncharacterized membrane protein